jgi:hypothetical protein
MLQDHGVKIVVLTSNNRITAAAVPPQNFESGGNTGVFGVQAMT